MASTEAMTPPPAMLPGPPAWSGSSSASRPVLLFLLFILICGQVFWVYRRLHGTPSLTLSNGANTPSATEERVPTPNGTAGAPSAPPPAALAPIAGSVPKNPTLEVNDLCLAISGADSRLALNLDARRRLEIVETLGQLAKAEEQRWNAVEQMRATFSDEQAKKIVEIIQQPAYADLSGPALRAEATRVLSKIANQTSAPTTFTPPVADAAKFDWDQSLRGGIALDPTNYRLTSSQAAQIRDAIPLWETATKKTRLWQTQLNSHFAPAEKQKIYRFRQILRARSKDVEARSKATTTTLRLLQTAIGTLQNQAQ